MSQLISCRIQGLTSAKGQKLNGLAASFDPLKPPQAEGRLAVTIDGVQGPPLAIKPQNLHMIHNPVEDLAVAVGRPDLRSEKMMATVVDHKRKKRVTSQMISATEGGGRSLGTLKALTEYFQTQKVAKSGGDILISVTDLNVALLLNSYAYAYDTITGNEKTLYSNQEKLAKKLYKNILRQSNNRRNFFFKYNPFRIERGDRDPKEMVAAAFAGRFHIYPCPCETYLDALEVRYLAPGRSTHCFFLDYGQEETVQYVGNISCMEDDLERLKPEVLADVDPQMFWSSVLHSKIVVKQLKKLPGVSDDLIKDWTNIYKSYLDSVMSFRKNCPNPSEAVRLLPDSKGSWNLINEKIHFNVANRNAKIAILLTLFDEFDEEGYPKKKPRGGPMFQRIEIMDNYKGSDIDMAVADLMKACNSNDPQDIEIALGAILTWKETKTCDYCGKKLKQTVHCPECCSALYCGRECQVAAWKTHKKVCKDLKKSREENPPEKQIWPTAKVRMYKPHKVEKLQNRKAIQVFSEACGLGFLRILWNPQMKSDKTRTNFVSFKAVKNNTIFKTEVHANQGGISKQSDIGAMLKDVDNVIMFDNDFSSDLGPILTLFLACGPIPNLDLAKRTLDDAWAQARGLPQNLRMPWVGFTVLEIAAKKGNLDIVQWLVSEPRTRPLLSMGTPVGWACYPGRVEVARFLVEQGASPEATSECYWDHRPPLLAAAEHGQVDAVKFLVEECGIDISLKWKGNGIKQHVEMAPCWYEMKGHNAVLDYAYDKGVIS